MATIQPPVVPRTERLPLESLGWDGFESFCRDLVSRMPGVRECHHYGKQGDTQLGIDLFADFDNGSRWAFQNKRWKEFGPADVEKAVQATTYPAQRYIILLSREATIGARNAVAKHATWDIWDVRDISQKVRELPLDSARRLLDQHLGAGVRRAFLGVSAVSIFPTPEDYFGSFEDRSRIFHHGWSLVGRVELLRGLRDFATSTAKRVAIFSGRGGIGKSKLLHAFAADASQGPDVPAIRFLADGLSVTPEAFDDLPLSACLVVVDDAHRRGDDIAALLALAQQCRPRIKLVLASRPQGMDVINSHLGRAGIEEREVERLGTVGDLTREETGRLAVQSLGEEYAHLADRLVALTRDCPLVTVVGGRLLAERAVDPALLESVDDFRATVLSKFHDVLIGQVGDRIEPSRCRSLLALLAAVAPVRPDGEPFLNAAADFLKCEPTEVATAMAVLEECGVLLRRGYSVRITPDVLADHLLNRACLTPHGRPTGFAQRVFDHFSNICPTEVLRNLAELDWRVRHATGQEPDLLASVWSGISDQFRHSPNSVRCQLLDVLRDITYYQPGRMVELIEYAVRNPATMPEDEGVQHLGLFSHEGVLEKLPELVRRIAYTLDYLPCCADLLWELGRDDRRQANPRPEHPIRILCGMAEYEIGKPFAFNEGMIEAVSRWLREPGAHDHAHSPLDVLDPIFVKSGSCAYSEGHSIAIRTFKVSSEDTQAMRDTALSQAGGRETNGGFLIDALVHNQPQVTEPLIESIFAAPDSPLAGCFALLLAHARQRDLSRGIEFARLAVASGHLSLCRAVGNLYCWSINWSEDGFEGDLAVLRSLLRHPDRGVVGLGIGGIRGLSRVRRETAVGEVLAVEVAESGELAEELFSVFHAELGIPLGTLADTDIDCLLRKLPPVNRLDHHVTQFLAHATSRRPHEVVNLLLDRAERGEAASDLDFEPLPYLGLHPALTALAECRDYDAIIRVVRDRSLRVDFRAAFWFPKLFKEVSLRYCPTSLTALTEWIDSGQAGRIAAATVLLTEAPAAFVFEHRDFVSNALVRASAAGDECYRRVCHHLRQCAAGHGRQPVGGGPFPQDVGLRDRASSVCATLRRGSPDHRFYESLRAEAVANIRKTEASDEELLG